MKPTAWLRPLPALYLTAALAGCSVGEDDAAVAARAVAKAKPGWRIQLDAAAGPTELPVEIMDIYLVENEDEYPEIFEIRGEGVTLVGSFPRDVHVGYEEAFDRLIGRIVTIAPSGGDPREPKSSWIRLDGRNVPVSGGSITFERVTGKWAGSEGDKTLWGRIEVRIPGAAGDRSVTGKVAVHAVTWG